MENSSRNTKNDYSEEDSKADVDENQDTPTYIESSNISAPTALWGGILSSGIV